MKYLVLATTLALLEAADGLRHRVSPGQQVWEQIRDNMDRKKPVDFPRSVFPGRKEPTTAELVDAEQVVVLKPKHDGSKFIQYNGRRPTGRHRKISAMSQQSNAEKSSRATRRMVQVVSKRVAELKARERERRENHWDSLARKVTKTERTAWDRKREVDHVFHPESNNSPGKHVVTGNKEAEHGFEDPFANLDADFGTTYGQELKTYRTSLLKKVKKEIKVVADPTEQLEKDIKLRELEVITQAGADVPSTVDFVFDVNKDLIGGLHTMEKDAEGMAAAQGTKAVEEAKAEGDVRRAAKKRKEKHAELAKAPVVSTKPPFRQKEESLAKAFQGVHAAEDQMQLDHSMQALGSLWAAKTNDKVLNSELAIEAIENRNVERAKFEKVLEIEDREEADALDSIDKEWKNSFPGTSSQRKVTQKKRAHSSWGTLSDDLTGRVIQG